MATRHKAREIAVQMLYQKDLNSEIPFEAVREMISEQLREGPLRDFCWDLYTGVLEFIKPIDEQLQESADHWTVDRMAPTDRNILRLGAFELAHTDTPASVILDESIELAKKFGTAQSSQFINGVLDRLAALRQPK